ncbi:hypothetical protein EJ03DRAFT_354550 [Teratosphaeria nubilosa]|uniref:Uncharacterized protein n=1 Tax=Teratosphaeria nubilosa TaxID=161662 RepID=A0A6G1L0J9_9PEZI|nr:hypothetical protein EJ03DRAFT_354550 [Teratosphaeria nubilosa]
MATHSVDRLAALPQELRGLIFPPLIPSTLEIKALSLPATHRKVTKTRIRLIAYEGQVYAAVAAKTTFVLDPALDADVTNTLPTAAPTPRPIPGHLVAGPRKLKLRDTYLLSDTAYDQYVISHQFTITICTTGPHGAKIDDLSTLCYTSLHGTPPRADKITDKMLDAQANAKRPIVESIVRHKGFFLAKMVQKLGQGCVLDGRVVGWRAVKGRVYGEAETKVLKRRYAKRRIGGSVQLVAALGREMEAWLKT